MNPFWHTNLESKISSLERDMYTKAATYELDRANSRIHSLEQELQRESANRQSLECRVESLERLMEEMRMAVENLEWADPARSKDSPEGAKEKNES